MRTTVDIDDPVPADLKRLQQGEGKSLGRLVSDLLAQSLATQRTSGQKPVKLKWVARGMQARVDLADREAVLDAMDEKLR